MSEPLMRVLRKEQKLRAMDVAQHMGISSSRYILMEKGKVGVCRNDALLLSRLYNRSEYEFLPRAF